MARRRIWIAGVVLTLAAAACSGPRSPVDVGVKEINTDVLIGPKEPTAVASPPASSPPGPIGFPGFVQPPVNRHPPFPTPSPVSCPQAHPLAPIERALTSEANTPPAEATYRFRNQGTWKIGERSGAFPVTSTRTVSNVVKIAPGGGYTFDVSIPDPGGPVTTTTYHVYPTQPRPIDPTPGIYIEQVVERSGGVPTQTFSPVPAVLLMQFPAAPGRTWTTRGVDPQSQTVMQFTGQVTSRSIIDACGTRLAAWTVSISEGVIRSPTTDVTFEATLQIATQYGGLSLVDDIRQAGTVRSSAAADAEALETSNKARIQQAPKDPA